MEQLTHTTVDNVQKNFPIVVIGDEIRTPQNIGMCIRVCEAFGIGHFYQNENSPTLENRLVQRTARNTDKQISVVVYPEIVEKLKALKKDGFTLIALEITNASKDIHTYDFTQHDKIALLIGSERYGIDAEALDICDVSIHIPMFGHNSSMNVVNSLSVSLYEITKQLNNTNEL